MQCTQCLVVKLVKCVFQEVEFFFYHPVMSTPRFQRPFDTPAYWLVSVQLQGL